MTAATTGIVAIESVLVPVADHDAAIDFYTRVLGFEKRFDAPFGDGGRWVEVAPPGSSSALSLQAGQETLFPVALILRTEDVDAEHARLRALEGVKVDAEVQRPGPPAPAMFRVEDPDGNSLWVVAHD